MMPSLGDMLDDGKGSNNAFVGGLVGYCLVVIDRIMHSSGDGLDNAFVGRYMVDDAFIGERVGYRLRRETGWTMHLLGDQMEDRLRQ